MTTDAAVEPPRAIRPADVARRYDISERLAGDWIRRAKAAGVIAAIGNVRVARWSAIDAWVASGGAETKRERTRSLRSVTGGRP